MPLSNNSPKGKPSWHRSCISAHNSFRNTSRKAPVWEQKFSIYRPCSPRTTTDPPAASRAVPSPQTTKTSELGTTSRSTSGNRAPTCSWRKVSTSCVVRSRSCSTRRKSPSPWSGCCPDSWKMIFRTLWGMSERRSWRSGRGITSPSFRLKMERNLPWCPWSRSWWSLLLFRLRSATNWNGWFRRRIAP